MDRQKQKIVLNDILVNKLESMSYDLKYYININYGIANNLQKNNVNTKLVSDEDLIELIDIRKKIKTLVHKLKN